MIDLFTLFVILSPRPEPTDPTALFARSGESRQTEDGVALDTPAGELLVAKLGPDGKPVLACVDSEAAARKFLDTPAKKQAREK